MGNLAADIARHERKLDNEAATEQRLEDAKVRFRHELLHGWPVTIRTDDGGTEEVDHKDTLLEWDVLSLWRGLASLHWEFEHCPNDKPTESTLNMLRQAMGDALDEAAERYAPMMLAAEDKKAAEWDESLAEPVDEMFFRRLG